ncbi:hypothetical protein SpCBS45565_g01369 [Spizellomyces sp. 'palustris']|nr:hypothetical protein SpCBS45565_g01369 [Spizellomyces sp. 'palustris']
MGGGGKYPYPKWVWSYTGGWWPSPKRVVTNSLITGAGIAGLLALVWNFSANHEVGNAPGCGKVSILEWVLFGRPRPAWNEQPKLRHRYPDRWIPSMLWSREFHDPAFKAMWEEQLAKEGRQWIEPIPDWWPFKKHQAKDV